MTATADQPHATQNGRRLRWVAAALIAVTQVATRMPTCCRLAPMLQVTGNHFSPHMFIEALKLDMRVIEIPVTFRKRAGISKGVGSNKIKAARVALRMLGLIYTA